MRIVLQDGPKKFELGRVVDGKGSGGRFHDATAADQFLRRFQNDPGAMMKLRQLAGDIAAPTFHRLGDRELLRYLAHSMARGRILLLSEAAPERQTMAVEEPPPAAPPPAARSAASAPPAAPPEPATFPASFDAIAQAAALRAAAQDGTPFCEECEKAKLAREREAAGAQDRVLTPGAQKSGAASPPASQTAPPATQTAGAAAPPATQAAGAAPPPAQAGGAAPAPTVAPKKDPTLLLTKIDPHFAPSVEKLELTYDIKNLSAETVWLEVESTHDRGVAVFARELTATEKADGTGKKLEWDGKCTAGKLSGKWVDPAWSPYDVRIKVDAGSTHAGVKDQKQTAVLVEKMETVIDAKNNKIVLNVSETNVLVTSKVFIKKKAGGGVVTPIALDVSFAFKPNGANVTGANSFVYSGTLTLGKQGDATAVYWEAHADSPSSSKDGYKTVCQAETIAAGADQGVAKIWFKPSGVGGNKYEVRGEVISADGTTKRGQAAAPEVTIWRKILLKPYEMVGQTHVSTHGTTAIMGGYYTATQFVEYELGTVNAVPGANSVTYIGLWDRATSAQLNWATHSAATVAETPTAQETTDANGPAGPAQVAARAAIQAKANAWRDRIIVAYTAGLNNWAADASVPVNAIVAIAHEHPKYSAASPDSVTAAWTAFPWLRILVEGARIHPDQRWVNGQGLSYGQRAYITAGMSAARTEVAIAHEAGHETKNQFKRALFGGGDHSAAAGLMDAVGSRPAFTPRETEILRGVK